MNQRVAVRAIVRNNDKTLLLRRAAGRATILGKYELPGGRIDDAEQPSDAIQRHIQQQLGVATVTTQLYSTATYIDHDDRDIQYVIIVYLVSLQLGGKKIHLGDQYDHYIWKKMQDVHQESITESSRLVLGLARGVDVAPHDSDEQKVSDEQYEASSDTQRLIVYSDGGSRGNPGPSAAGFVVMDASENVLYTGGLYLGITTNNQAEYHGVRLGLEKALELHARTVDFRIDSLLVVNQMNGVYKIKNRELWPINERIKELVGQFDTVSFMHVRREFNQKADSVVNKILDEQAHEV
jgi:mutator protein MutT